MANFNYSELSKLLVILFIIFLGGLVIIWAIISTLFGRIRLRITQSKISRSWEIFGLRYWLPMTTPQQNIIKIELTSTVLYKQYPDAVKVPHQIHIWAGTKKFTIGNDTINLTSPEHDWLANELSSWLNLPISREF